jgi:hypothetical protein
VEDDHSMGSGEAPAALLDGSRQYAVKMLHFKHKTNPSSDDADQRRQRRGCCPTSAHSSFSSALRPQQLLVFPSRCPPMISPASDAASTARACASDQTLALSPIRRSTAIPHNITVPLPPNSARRFYTWTGTVFSFQPQQPQQQLFGFVGFNVARCIKDSKV